MKRNVYNTFTVGDPRLFDGDPFDVVERAIAQTEAVAEILAVCIEDANKMARNAEMERQLLGGAEADALSWPDSVQGRKFAAALEAAGTITKQLSILRKAASFNPRRPPKA